MKTEDVLLTLRAEAALERVCLARVEALTVDLETAKGEAIRATKRVGELKDQLMTALVQDDDAKA